MRHIILIIVTVLLLFPAPLLAQNKDNDTGTLDTPETRTIVKTKLVVAKDPTLAGLLSAQFPGVGQMYCRKWLKGGILLIGTAALYGIANDFSTRANDDTLSQEERDKNGAIAAGFFIAGLTVHVWNVIDAIKTAERHNQSEIELHTSQRNVYFDIQVGLDKARLGLTKRM